MHEYPREELGPEAGRRWLALSPEDRADALILAPTHAIRRQVNETVREGLEAEGLLHGRVLVVDRLVNRRLTRAQASDLRSYEPGDTIVFHRDVFGCRAGDVCMVTGRDGGQVVLAGPDGGERRFRPSGNASAYLGLYDTERIELRAGDRIRWTRNRKAPPARFGHPRQPDLVNGGEAEILEIDRKRVRFRDEVGRTFSFLLSDPQLRHLDHAYCSTVHAAQGRTARGVIAVLDAHGATDQALFHVEVSRAAEAFLLLTDDREALVEMLEARPDREEGALEALGLDPAEPPVVEPELFEALAADWRALRGQAGETDAQPFSLPGYEEVMARAAALSVVEDLPADMRGFVDGMLAEHERHVAHEREVRGLAGRIREHWRRWPELGWLAADRGCEPEELPEHPAWREDGTALLEAARGLELAPGLASGIEGEVAALERTRLRDDCGRFRRDWLALSVRAIRDGVPEVHAEGCADVADLGRRLSDAEGLDPAARRMVEAWRKIHDRQSARAEAVRTLPDRMEAWRARRETDLPLDEHGAADPVDPACRAWREEGEALRDEAAGMLEAESPHAPHLDAVPGTREAVDEALAEIDGTVQEDRYRRFAWLTRHVAGRSRETETASFHLPRYPELIAHARMHAGDEALTEDRNRIVNNWLGYHERCTRLCAEIRDWPAQADAVLGEWTGPERNLEPMRRWRARAEPLLAGARAMLVDGSAHAPHLAAMPEERAALVETAGWLDSALDRDRGRRNGAPCGDRRRVGGTDGRHRLRCAAASRTDGARALARRPAHPSRACAGGRPCPSRTARTPGEEPRRCRCVPRSVRPVAARPRQARQDRPGGPGAGSPAADVGRMEAGRRRTARRRGGAQAAPTAMGVRRPSGRRRRRARRDRRGRPENRGPDRGRRGSPRRRRARAAEARRGTQAGEERGRRDFVVVASGRSRCRPTHRRRACFTWLLPPLAQSNP